LMRLEQHLLAQIIQTWGMVWPPGESNLLCRQVFSTPPEATHEYTACLATAPRFLRTADHRGALPRRPDQGRRAAATPSVRRAHRPDAGLRRRAGRPP